MLTLTECEAWNCMSRTNVFYYLIPTAFSVSFEVK
jgi:hypothetical protein